MTTLSVVHFCTRFFYAYFGAIRGDKNDAGESTPL